MILSRFGKCLLPDTEKKVRADGQDFDGNKVFARYSSFSIDGESDGYRLNVSGFTNGGAGG